MTEVAPGERLGRLPSGAAVAAGEVAPVSAASLHAMIFRLVATAGLVETAAELGRG